MAREPGPTLPAQMVDKVERIAARSKAVRTAASTALGVHQRLATSRESLVSGLARAAASDDALAGALKSLDKGDAPPAWSASLPQAPTLEESWVTPDKAAVEKAIADLGTFLQDVKQIGTSARSRRFQEHLKVRPPYDEWALWRGETPETRLPLDRLTETLRNSLRALQDASRQVVHLMDWLDRLSPEQRDTVRANLDGIRVHLVGHLQVLRALLER